jgi:hypothetical protein
MTSFVHPRRHHLVVSLATALALAGGTGVLAQGASITVEPTGPLPTGPTTLTVTGTGFSPAGTGIYVVFGPITPAPGYYLDPSIYGAFKWVHAGASQSPVEAPLAEDGSFALTLDVTSMLPPSTGAVDCAVTACGVITFAAHGSPDRSQDTCAAVSFVAGAATSPGASATASAPVPSSPMASIDPGASAIPGAGDPCAVIGAGEP